MSKSKSISEDLPKINLNAAGIDIGSTEHYVAVPPGRDKESVRAFGSFTSDLHSIANWLKECKIETVAMESTGVYWLPLFQILESRGFEVLLVNAQHVKNVPGRKTDVQDCQWLQRLHTYGLLNASFQPDDRIRMLRTYLRQRDTLIRSASSHIQRMQKALTLMNIKLHNVISDITGKSGMNILRAISDGERNPDNLVKLCDKGLKASEEVIRKSLEGQYTEDNIFALKQEIELYDFYQLKQEECNNKISDLLKTMESKSGSSDAPKLGKKKPKADTGLQKEIARLAGVDLTQIDGINTTTLSTLVAETGVDMSKWKTAKHFTSWLGLSPNNKISGGKILSSASKKIKSRANNAFRLAAFGLSRSETYLGAAYRRLKSRIGPAKATTAIARKIAVIYYSMIKYGQSYQDLGGQYYEKCHAQRTRKNLEKRAREFGLTLVSL